MQCHRNTTESVLNWILKKINKYVPVRKHHHDNITELTF